MNIEINEIEKELLSNLITNLYNNCGAEYLSEYEEAGISPHKFLTADNMVNALDSLSNKLEITDEFKNTHKAKCLW